MTYPKMIAERVQRQASAIGLHPARLLLEELLDLQRAYVLALEIVIKESTNVDRAGGGIQD